MPPNFCYKAEGEGFEPSDVLPSAIFQVAALSHSVHPQMEFSIWGCST